MPYCDHFQDSRCIHTPQVFTCCRAPKCHDRATICLIKNYKPSPSRPNFAPERPATSCGLDFQGTIDGIHFERCKRWYCWLHHVASEKKVTLSQKKRCCLILTQKFSRHALRLSETHGSDLKIAMRCCFLMNLFGGAFYVIPGCGFFEVLEIKNLVETPLAMTIRKTRWIVGYDVCRSPFWTGWLWFCPSGCYSLVN